MEHHHVDEPTVAVYEDIKAVLKLPFVNTDYRAFARWRAISLCLGGFGAKGGDAGPRSGLPVLP